MKTVSYIRIGMAAVVLTAGVSANAAEMPSQEEMWQLIQQQQREIDALKSGQKTNAEKAEADIPQAPEALTWFGRRCRHFLSPARRLYGARTVNHRLAGTRRHTSQHAYECGCRFGRRSYFVLPRSTSVAGRVRDCASLPSICSVSAAISASPAPRTSCMTVVSGGEVATIDLPRVIERQNRLARDLAEES